MPSTTNSTLQNNSVPKVQSGQANVIMPLQADKMIFLNIVLNLQHQEQFEKCLVSINDPASPNYHHFLNSTTIMPYLPTSGQKTSIASFLTANGFKVEYTSSPLVLKASAPVSTAESTFGVKIKVYQVPPNKEVTHANNFQNMIHTRYGRPFYAADSDPRLPNNISILVNSIQGLDNYTMVKPLESPCTGPYCPQGIQLGYSLSSLHSRGFDGSGQNVAIVDCAGDPNPQSAIDTYDAQYGLAPATLKIFYPDGAPSAYDPSWASETMMDIEVVHTVAPGATIDLVYDDCSSGSPMNGIDYVSENHIAGIVSNSWGFSCSSGTCSDVELSPSLVSSSDNRLALDTAQGMTILFASGDDGATPDGAVFPN
ncbi:MAG: S53 family peptidase [Rhabdochlamydiaceae bacterium]